LNHVPGQRGQRERFAHFDPRERKRVTAEKESFTHTDFPPPLPIERPMLFLPPQARFRIPLPLPLIAAAALFSSWVEEAGAWGSGHDDVMREVIERLPNELRNSLTPEMIEEAIHHQSHYPDNFDPFLPEDVGEATVIKLAAAGVTKRYDLHSERGIAEAFLMLVDALREENAAHTALWIAAYSHVIADMAASNHDPLVHTATYAWAEWKLKLPSGEHDFSQVRPLLDLAGSAHDPAGGEAAFVDAIERMALKDEGQEAAEILAEIMLYGQAGADFCGPRGARVLEGAAGWVDREDPAAREMLWKNLGELGAWAVVRTLRDIEIAERFAKSDQELALTPAIEDAHRENVARFLSERRLEDDALFAPLLSKIDDASEPATGIVFEPCWAMNGAMLGFASRVESAAIARSWKKAETPYITLDLRQILSGDIPSPERMPQLVVVGSSFNSYRSLKADPFDRSLESYLDAGGGVLWISGTGEPPAKSFASLRKAMHRESPKAKLPVSNDDFLGARLRLTDGAPNFFTIEHSAETKAGWQKPFSPWTFASEKETALRPLATLEAGGESFIVGVIDAERKRALLPIYAVTPYLFAGDDRIESPHEPSLDSASAAVLAAALKALTPTP